jgi:hypothetical protein
VLFEIFNGIVNEFVYNNKLMKKKRKQLEDVQTNLGINIREIRRRKSTSIKRTIVEGMGVLIRD